MEVTAKLRYLRIAPRKVRLVADLVRGKSVEEATHILNFTRKRAAKPILKLLNSAIANASHNFQLKKENLYISKIVVNEGPKLKRWRPRARGVTYEIQKKTSHITLVLTEMDNRNLKRKSQKSKPRLPDGQAQPKSQNEKLKPKKKK
ncbi:50S ribosomal protein L22 [bacterium]|nr:50S ribosomal protein L22 [bacterium]